MSKTVWRSCWIVCAMGLFGEAFAACGPSRAPSAPNAVEAGDAGLSHGPADDPSKGTELRSFSSEPAPLVATDQWLFHLRWQSNEPRLVDVGEIAGAKPEPTPRVMGRFSLELSSGETLLERVRFDFPLLAPVAIADAGYRSPPSFERGLATRVGVLFPKTKLGSRLELVDHVTGRRWELPWPPAPDSGAAELGQGTKQNLQ